ncbi:unnamed protein product [Caenorhabditis brenneri]
MIANYEKRVDCVVTAAVEGAGQFYSVRFEPPPSKTTFDVTLKTYASPNTEYVATVTIPKTYPLTAPSIFCKKDPKVKFRFLEKSQWKPSIGIREVLIEACHVMSRRDLSSRMPVLPKLRPPVQKTRGSKSPKKSD